MTSLNIYDKGNKISGNQMAESIPWFLMLFNAPLPPSKIHHMLSLF